MTTSATELSGRSIDRESPHTSGSANVRVGASVSSDESVFGRNRVHRRPRHRGSHDRRLRSCWWKFLAAGDGTSLGADNLLERYKPLEVIGDGPLDHEVRRDLASGRGFAEFLVQFQRKSYRGRSPFLVHFRSPHLQDSTDEAPVSGGYCALKREPSGRISASPAWYRPVPLPEYVPQKSASGECPIHATLSNLREPNLAVAVCYATAASTGDLSTPSRCTVTRPASMTREAWLATCSWCVKSRIRVRSASRSNATRPASVRGSRRNQAAVPAGMVSPSSQAIALRPFRVPLRKPAAIGGFARTVVLLEPTARTSISNLQMLHAHTARHLWRERLQVAGET